MIALQLVLAILAIAFGGQKDKIPVNIHTCELQQRDHLQCPWMGHGLYQADRPLIGVHQLTFAKLLKPSSIDLTGPFNKDLKVLDVTNGDIECQDITAPDVNYIFINHQRACMVRTLCLFSVS